MITNNLTPLEFLKENRFVILKDFIPKDMAYLLYKHTIVCAKRLSYLNYESFEEYKDFQEKEIYGNFLDPQSPDCFSFYGDPIMDTLMEELTPKIIENIGFNIFPSYTYYRLYFSDSKLPKHKDRPSCEISSTLCLGYDVSNVDQKKYTNYSWPIFVESKGKELPIRLEPGDMMLYYGCDIEHWRNPFLGLNHAQVFLHYVTEQNTDLIYDQRPTLGLPVLFKPGNRLHPLVKKSK